MSFIYDYPKQASCDHRILLIKFFDIFNFRPDKIDWFQGISDNAERIYIHSSGELTKDEKMKLDGLMADPSSGISPQELGLKREQTVFVIEDIFDYWESMEEAVGAKIRWIFPNVPDHTKIEIWFDRKLSPAKKKKVLETYSKLISEKI